MGNLSEFISAVAAVGALLAAIWAGRTAKELYGIEAARDLKAVEQEERRAASHVSAWVCTHFPEGPGDKQSRRDGVLVANQGECPVYELRIESTGKDGRAQKEIVQHVLPPGEYFIAFTMDAYRWDFPEQAKHLAGIIRPITKKPEWTVTSLEFTDANGLHWRRDERGRLGAVQR